MTNTEQPHTVGWNGRLQSWLKRDGLIILLYLVLTIGMTWPLAANFGESWLGSRDADTFVKLWDQWWIQRRIDTNQPLLYTTDLFYPEGLDLSYHSISLTVAPVSALLVPWLGHIDAYNITILAAIFTTAYAGYLLGYYLFENRAAAWLCGFVYSFAPYHMTHTGGHPDLVHLASIPLSIWFLLVAARNGRQTWTGIAAAVGTALMIGISTLASLYIMVFALLTIAPFFVYASLEDKHWRSPIFWRNMMIVGVIAGGILGVRLFSVFDNGDTLTSAIESKYRADWGQTDLRAFVTPSHYNPIFAPYTQAIAETFNMNQKWPAYLGLIPLALTLVALTWKKRLAEILAWFLTGIMFLIFTLGPALRMNGTLYPNMVLPASYLSSFPPIRAVGRPDFFVLGLLLPLAVCAGFGLRRLLQLSWFSSRPKGKLGFVLLLSAVLIFEFWNGPYPGGPLIINPFYIELGTQTESFALVELPMGRSPSKEYVMYQVFHEKPIIEGLSARTPPQSYRYIRNNQLLENWRQTIPHDCAQMGDAALKTAVSQLVQDNIRYAIIHNNDKNAAVFHSYFAIPPTYQDHELTVYALADLGDSTLCTNNN